MIGYGLNGKRNENPEDRLKVLKLFLDYGQNVNAISESERSILHWCAKFAWVDAVKHLMSREPKPDLTIKDNWGGSEFSQFVVKSAPNIYIF